MVNLVGEIGINHNGDIDLAKKLINIASYAGFHYVKFQKRTIDLVYTQDELDKPRKSIYGNTNGDLKRGLEFGYDEYKEIDRFCQDRNIKWFVSVWDIESAKFMTDFTNDLIKIPSPIITNLSILDFCRRNFKRVMVSTGMSTQKEIDAAIAISSPDIIMHSVSVYPTGIPDLNLRYISSLISKFPGKEIGYSGHEFGVDFLPYLVGKGITWIEKHITLNKNMWGSDQKSSIDPEEMFRLSRILNQIKVGTGNMTERVLLDNEVEFKNKLRKE